MKPPDDWPPETDVEIERKPFDFQEHDWQQKGYSLSCPGTTCSMFPYAHGTSITAGKMLVGQRGSWRLIDEGGNK